MSREDSSNRWRQRLQFEFKTIFHFNGREGLVKVDLGWMAFGSMERLMESAFSKLRKGDIFKAWSKNRLHIIRKLDEYKKEQDMC